MNETPDANRSSGSREEQAIDRLDKTTAEFMDVVNHRLRRLDRNLYYKYILFIAGFVVGGFFLWNESRAINRHRREAIQIQCAIVGAVTGQGHDTILLPTREKHSTPFEKFLEQHGYPPLAVRRIQAKRQANQYVAGISQRINSITGGKTNRLLNKNGTINCSELARLSGTSQSPRRQ